MKKQRYVAEMVVRVLDENRYGNPEYDYCDIVEADSPDEALEKWIAIETEGGNLNSDVKRVEPEYTCPGYAEFEYMSPEGCRIQLQVTMREYRGG